MNEGENASPLSRLRLVDRFISGAKRAFRMITAKPRSLAATHLIEDPRPVLKILLIGTSLVVSMLLILLAISFFILKNYYVFGRMVTCSLVFIYLFYASISLAKQRYKKVAYMLVALYAYLAVSILWQWSINAPVGILTFCFVITLAGVTLGSRAIIVTTAIVILLLTLLQVSASAGLTHPDTSSLALASSFGDVASFSTLFAIVALVSWLSRKQMEQSLIQAQQAEAALAKEKELLAARLEARTRDLRILQLEEMKQLYRFAELGQLSTALLHELANHLTVLTLDIQDLHQQHSRSKSIQHAKESIAYLDRMINQVRRQLKEDSEPQKIELLSLLDETIVELEQKARAAHVQMKVTHTEKRKQFTVIGDPLRFKQIVTVLSVNAIEAYAGKTSNTPRVEIETAVQSHKLQIRITDFGVGIPLSDRSKLFEPFHSTKKDGMGIGLFIAKSMIETHFKGSLALSDASGHTTFIITLPEHNRARRK